MTELLMQQPVVSDGGGGGGVSGRGEFVNVRRCRSPGSLVARYSAYEERPSGLGLCELKHSKSDDLVLQSAPSQPAEMHHGISDVALQIQKEACVVYEDDLAPMPCSLPVYYSDSETCPAGGGSPRGYSPPSSPEVITAPLPPPPPPPTALKITGGDFQGAGGGSRPASRPVSVCDRLDPEDSIRDIISENDFYRFVLFKRHYQKYLDISQKYEEARNIAYYLEEKYHEIKAERDRLAKSQKDLQKRLETRDQEMLDKEEELFLQLEKAIRLEEDCEKIREEKERMSEWKDRLEREKNEAYRQFSE
ncbi:hypothetical protein LSTR_LSTR012372 [Laodelphax striatellus]|uniref:Uncharacterized protein n=1 Tax=Laodelphax striatellus TaxID=195883 RepID=A0A482WPP5_LAOST|nr:hypothetical protein LSTR_LSTR012372 [Laodelphax striatellus]